MHGNVRKPSLIGEYRKEQNYIGKYDKTHAITFIPPTPDNVPCLMDNLIEYINKPSDKFRPLVRTAIIHTQFETIHPFMDGNGRVGRMLLCTAHIILKSLVNMNVIHTFTTCLIGLSISIMERRWSDMGTSKSGSVLKKRRR